MFTILREVCAAHDLDFQVTSLNIVFEKACHKSVLALWPDVSIHGCHFHLSQAWYRKLCELGLSVEYKTPDSEIGRWLKMFFGLSFVTPEDVPDTMAFDIMPDTPDVSDLLTMSARPTSTMVPSFHRQCGPTLRSTG